jgi:hypothetical protein
MNHVKLNNYSHVLIKIVSVKDCMKHAKKNPLSIQLKRSKARLFIHSTTQIEEEIDKKL